MFNLSVDRSHAYWVGSADVLVHNTKCGNGEDRVTRKTREIEETQRKLDALKNGEASSSSEQPLDREKKIAELEVKIKEIELGWQTSTQKRLDETRRLLHDMQGSVVFSDETLEAELAQQIALLEHELTHRPSDLDESDEAIRALALSDASAVSRSIASG